MQESEFNIFNALAVANEEKVKRICELQTTIDGLKRQNKELINELAIKDKIIKNQTILMGASKNEAKRCFKLTHNAPIDTIMPTRKTKGSAGYDFYAPREIIIPPKTGTPIIGTGVKVYMPQDEVLLLHIRSSVGLFKSVTLSNCTGIIDSDYVDNPDNEGEIGFALYNNSDHVAHFRRGERIMQGIFVKYQTVDNDETTDERKGGTGSSGKF